MQVDSFTFIAQIVNFLILVLLLRRFLYGPIVAAMDERQRLVDLAQSEAAASKLAADAEARQCKAQREELQAQRQSLLVEAEQDAQGRRKELVRKARTEVGEQQRRWLDALRQDKEAFLKELKSKAGEQLWKLAERAMADLASKDLEEHIVNRFIARLGELEDDERDAFRKSCSDGGVSVLSAFELESDTKRSLEAAVKEHLIGGAKVDFQLDSEIIAGIEIKTPGYKFGWSVHDYLQDLEDELQDLLELEVSRQASVSEDPAGDAVAPALDAGEEEGASDA